MNMLTVEIPHYKTWIFDCDGVILDSNGIKSEVFYEVALPFGKDKAEALVAYHKRHGGVSRYKKFEHFFSNILGMKNAESALKEATNRYGEIVRHRLLHCPETDGLRPFLEGIPREIMKIVVSGGMQRELQEVFRQRNLHHYFNAIYGSPESKEAILRRTLNKGLLAPPAVFIGDSLYDYECAKMFHVDFIFMSQYTEFEEWRDFFQDKEIIVIQNFGLHDRAGFDSLKARPFQESI